MKSQDQGLRTGDAAEHLEHEVTQAVAVAVHSRDDERLTCVAEQHRVRRVDELRFVRHVRVALRGRVHLLFEHAFVHTRHRELWTAEHPGVHGPRVLEGELGDNTARVPGDPLGAKRELV